MRLVTAQVAPRSKARQQGAQPIIYQIISDRWDLTAEEIVEIYLYRWKIELFFRWLKSHIRLPRLLGYSQNAVQLTVWLALLVHLLTILITHKLNLSRRSPKLLKTIYFVLITLPAEELRFLHSHPTQLPVDWDFPVQVPT